MRKYLKLPMSKLFQDVAKKHGISTEETLAVDGSFELNDDDLRARLLDAISSEFIDTGLQSNDEPNERGLMLEDLLDLVNDLKGSKKPQ